MPRLRLLAALIAAFCLLLFAAGCSDGVVSEQRRVLPTAEPAPTVPGQSIEGFAPTVDDRVTVVGIGADETLAVHALPGVDQPIVAQLSATANNLFGYGETYESPDGRVWWLIRYENAQGWIEPGAAYIGASRDVSVQVAAALSTSTFISMEQLVADIAGQYQGNYIVVNTTPESDRGDIITMIDLLALEDDSPAGQRLIITGQRSEGGQFRLSAVQELALCARGVTAEGNCS